MAKLKIKTSAPASKVDPARRDVLEGPSSSITSPEISPQLRYLVAPFIESKFPEDSREAAYSALSQIISQVDKLGGPFSLKKKLLSLQPTSVQARTIRNMITSKLSNPEVFSVINSLMQANSGPTFEQLQQLRRLFNM